MLFEKSKGKLEITHSLLMLQIYLMWHAHVHVFGPVLWEAIRRCSTLQNVQNVFLFLFSINVIVYPTLVNYCKFNGVAVVEEQTDDSVHSDCMASNKQ